MELFLISLDGMSKLTDRQKQICRRLRQVRERLGLTQEKVAAQVGITRERLLIYEYARAPLRFDLALRFCRQLVISEEWLATGKFTEAFQAARGLLPPEGDFSALDKIFWRQCVDLASEPIYFEIPPGADFAEAYDTSFKPVYSRLVLQHFYMPRVILRDSDNEELILNFHTACLDRWLYLLINESKRFNKNPGYVRRVFLRALFETGSLTFARFIGMPTPDVNSPDMEWLRIMVNDPEAPIGPLFETETKKRSTRGKLKTDALK